MYSLLKKKYKGSIQRIRAAHASGTGNIKTEH